MNIQKTRKGFTLVELLVAVTIVAILSVTAFVAFGGQTLRARNAKRQEHLSSIQSALELYFTQNNVYPTVTEFNDPLEASNPLVPEFISIIPSDPWEERAYVYGAGPVATFPRAFQLAATEELDAELETDPLFRALVVGNGTGLINTGVRTDTGAACTTTPIEDDETDCVPYLP